MRVRVRVCARARARVLVVGVLADVVLGLGCRLHNVGMPAAILILCGGMGGLLSVLRPRPKAPTGRYRVYRHAPRHVPQHEYRHVSTRSGPTFETNR